MGISEVDFEVGPYLVYRGFGIPEFGLLFKDACVGDDYFFNADYFGVCFRDASGFGYCGVLTDGVEDIGDRIDVDVELVYFLLEGFIEA